MGIPGWSARYLFCVIHLYYTGALCKFCRVNTPASYKLFA